MADDRFYRIHIDFDPEGERFVARTFELDASGQGETRLDALQALEEDLESKVEATAVERETLPPPKPSDPEASSRALTLELAGLLDRDLTHLARQAKLSKSALATQLLARAIGSALGRPEAPRATAPTAGSEAAPEPGGGEDRSQGQRNRRRNRKRQEGYRPDIDDQANFLAYVRDMEKGGGRRR